VAASEQLTGAHVELDVGAPAHGGHCVARLDGRVVFVRHALPGERVRAVVTEEHGSFCRADAIAVLRASPDRVPAPCPHAGPGRCGGCDWQHASAHAQRELKAAVVREQFTRLAKLDVADLLAGVEPLPGGLLGWRTRITFAVDAAGRPGLHRHRSHEVEHMTSCPLGASGIGDTEALRRAWPGLTGVEAVRGDAPDVALLAHRPRRGGRQGRGRRPPDVVEQIEGPDTVTYRAGERDFAVEAGGFWQVHPAAAETFSAALIEALAPRAGETALDLYCGAGLLTAALADAVGPTGRVLGVESSDTAVANAMANLAGTPWARAQRGRVDPALIGQVAGQLEAGPDLVVLDPPRAGAGKDVMRAVTALSPRAIGYVACDPAALARDVAAARDAGWRLSALRAFDAFPMTHHVECVATLIPS
jgi:tRNA/tmRNA/rRNA uracil-C5-methylase (TrmA/RlmC/RlmD family)